MTQHDRRPDIAVITGAGGGLGREVARTLARDGALVACSDVDNTALAETVKLVQEQGGTATGSVVDVSDDDSVRRWSLEVSGELGTPGILVNCVGVLPRRQMHDTTTEEFMRVQAINLGGTYTAIRQFGPAMIEQRHGRIINIASIAGLGGYPFPAYAASKAGVVNLTKSLLADFWGSGVTINAICPGAMQTPMLDQAAISLMRRRTPTGDITTTAEIAQLVAFLCSPAARNINGAAIPVDGGATAYFSYRAAGESD